MGLRFEKVETKDLDSLWNLVRQHDVMDLKEKYQLDILLARDDYRVKYVFDDNDNLLGYVMYLKRKDYMWLDFFTVLPNQRNKGYGRAIIQQIIDRALTLQTGMFFEINTPDGDDYEQELAIKKFVESTGMLLLDVPYKYAAEFVDTKASLYFRAGKKLRKLKGRTLKSIIEDALSIIHSDIYTIDQTIDSIKDSIINRNVYYRK